MEKEQMRENMKKELDRIKNDLLNNSVDKELGEKLIGELNELVLIITSFEFTEKLVTDPSFMQMLLNETSKTD